MKRRLLTIAIFLLAGAVVNVAVAWGCAVWVPTHNSQRVLAEHETDSIFELIPRPDNYDYLLVFHSMAFGVTKTEVVAGFFGSTPNLALPTRYAAGWPLRSLQGAWRWRDQLVSAVLTPDWFPASWGRRVLPLRPIWLGFVFNTLFFAAVLWLVIPGPFALRRFIRVSRGLCPQCAYPMGESAVCSECGQEPLGYGARPQNVPKN